MLGLNNEIKIWQVLGALAIAIAFWVSADINGYNRCLVKTELEKETAKNQKSEQEKQKQNEIINAKNIQQKILTKNSSDEYRDDFFDEWLRIIQEERTGN